MGYCTSNPEQTEYLDYLNYSLALQEHFICNRKSCTPIDLVHVQISPLVSNFLDP